MKQLDTEIRMKKYYQRAFKIFLFDGERIGNMSKEIKRGRSQEFAGAVQSLLGLSAYTAALSHLKGRGNTNVLRVYEASYDAKVTVKLLNTAVRLRNYQKKLKI